jgi:hypothetical protein
VVGGGIGAAHVHYSSRAISRKYLHRHCSRTFMCIHRSTRLVRDTSSIVFDMAFADWMKRIGKAENDVRQT